ncbi:hypothetical protein IU449_19510 [Nocardia higoensis]|uniref:Secreted protein n=1 Tax=Nocardia higoensis TaxID=228599 RepID=A0ABS0DE15_9NOCA|nr:hypothetical protein [Nocardia higoensis]MBF6356706.1 hypothetical protein [Nocardia higoensis]
MKRSITGLALAGALLFPGQLVAAGSAVAGPSTTVPAQASQVAGSSEVGCNLQCGPLMELWIALYEGLALGSSNGGGAPATP